MGERKICQEPVPSAWNQGNEAGFQDDQKRKGTLRQVPIQASRQVHQVLEPGHGNRHHIHQDSMGHDVLHGCHRFVQQKNPELASVRQHEG